MRLCYHTLTINLKTLIRFVKIMMINMLKENNNSYRYIKIKNNSVEYKCTYFNMWSKVLVECCWPASR